MADPKFAFNRSLEMLPAQKAGLFGCFYNGVGALAASIGFENIASRCSQNLSLAEQGSKLALSVEGDDWRVHEEAIHELWKTIIEALAHSWSDKAQDFSNQFVLSSGIQLALERRIKIYQYLKRNPEVTTKQLSQPVIIVGFPRTGSTLLQRLLAQDENAQSHQFWEYFDPVPTRLPTSVDRALRKQKMRQAFKLLEFMIPNSVSGGAAFHPTSPTQVEEETPLMWSVGLMGPLWWMHSNRDVCEQIFSSLGKEASYRFLRRCLQLLSSVGTPKSHLILKSPFHTTYLKALVEEFPDARLISIHRKPEAIVRSWISYQAQVARGTFKENSFRMEELVRPNMQFLSRSAEELAGFLKTFDEKHPDRHVAVGFRNLVSNPMEVVDGIYDRFGLSKLNSSSRERMDAFLTQKDAERTRAALYTLAELGIGQNQLDECFSAYNEAWGHLVNE